MSTAQDGKVCRKCLHIGMANYLPECVPKHHRRRRFGAGRSRSEADVAGVRHPVRHRGSTWYLSEKLCGRSWFNIMFQSAATTA